MEPNLPADNENASATAGQMLRRCREAGDITLETASEATKISKNYLKALEEDRYDEFTNVAYLKGFLKNYATYLGMNPDDLLKALEISDRMEPNLPNESDPEKKIQNRRRLWQKMVLPIMLLAGIIVTAIFYSPGTGPFVRTTSPVPPPVEKPVMKPVSSSIAASSVPAPPATTNPAAPATPPIAARLPETQQGLLVKMKVIKNGAMTVTIDHTSPQPYELTSGDRIEWKADRLIAMELSDNSGVELVMNGKPLKVPGQSGSPASIIIDSEGIRH